MPYYRCRECDNFQCTTRDLYDKHLAQLHWWVDADAEPDLSALLAPLELPDRFKPKSAPVTKQLARRSKRGESSSSIRARKVRVLGLTRDDEAGSGRITCRLRQHSYY